MTFCYLGLGSNLKTPERLIRLAIITCKTLPKTCIIQHASLYRTKPWGITQQPEFCNTVICIWTKLRPLQLMEYCQKVEKQFGRVRKKRWGPRTLDIDILIYGKIRKNSPKLNLPHPYYKKRDFVLEPLQELCLKFNPLGLKF